MLEAPVNYFVGLHSDVFTRLTDVPPSAVVVDLDNNTVTVAPDLPIIEFPLKVKAKLRHNLKVTLTKLEVSVTPNSLFP